MFLKAASGRSDSCPWKVVPGTRRAGSRTNRGQGAAPCEMLADRVRGLPGSVPSSPFLQSLVFGRFTAVQGAGGFSFVCCRFPRCVTWCGRPDITIWTRLPVPDFRPVICCLGSGSHSGPGSRSHDGLPNTSHSPRPNPCDLRICTFPVGCSMRFLH
jgi:hypothetical protein